MVALKHAELGHEVFEDGNLNIFSRHHVKIGMIPAHLVSVAAERKIRL